jgi:hypothetical protein
VSYFQWGGRQYPMPRGWDGLSMEDWFYQLETVRDHLMHADDEDLEPIYDDRGDPLDPEEVLLIRVYGFEYGGHWEAFRNWGVNGWARQARQEPTKLEFRMSGIARERMQREKAAAMTGRGGGGGGLDPVEGVSVEQWAQIQAKLVGGGDIDQLIAQAGMDRPKWDRVSAEWMARMQTDTTHTISTAYGNAFAGAAQGQYGAQAARATAVGVGGDLGAEPISFERFVEITTAQGAGAQRGYDASAVLAHFGMTVVDWSNVGMFWSKRIQQDPMKYHQLMTEYREFYEAKYAG